MNSTSSTSSPRQTELLEAAYRYALEHGLADLSLRPLAAAVGSSPRVLLYLFGSKDGLIRALLERARADELDMLERVRAADLSGAALGVWEWLATEEHRALLTLWAEGYARSLVDPTGPWAEFAEATVRDWLTLLASAQPEDERATPLGEARRTRALAVLRGALLDLLATGDTDRVGAAVQGYFAAPDDDAGDPAPGVSPGAS
ncbi:TetR/AcrR family transcriptional regulator [Nocardiopsis sp. EMB25]|uniref:TetR/AcrR family transcriptional regulator n=1 Tax=Nocardiopsis sp. EMB25 TaxID=2835867 RepID=UPI0022849167|nr:TetR/AcrR family transcriptional regulator [Nocardiopsis sp. EMB25]MCY9785332.1 TetR/AcrR family transcriptional regulator [Nocardiopsis sp. EMB25]